MTKMKITIITPSYNQSQYIRQTIDSVWSQEGDFFIEHIVADGGSTDGTIKILKELEQKLLNGQYVIRNRGVSLKWWSKKDRGQADAINQGMRMATGNIVAWINSDDYYEPNVFIKVVKLFKNYPSVDLLYGCCNQINEVDHTYSTILARPTSFRALIRHGGNAIPQPSSFFSRDILKKVNYLDGGLKYSLDYELFVKIAKEGQLLCFPNQVFANFRIWDNSKSHAQIKNFSKERLKVRKRYGGSVIDIKSASIFVSKHKIFLLMHRNIPWLYKGIRRMFYWVFDRLNFRS